MVVCGVSLYKQKHKEIAITRGLCVRRREVRVEGERRENE
jgi:hypothetical protein